MIWSLHGAMGSPGDWEFLETRGVDCRRFPLWETVDTFEAWAQRFCMRVGAEDGGPVLMGYSMGGRLALHALLARPDLWKGGIIVSAHPGLESEEERRGRVSADGEWARRVREEDMGDVFAAWCAQPMVKAGRGPGDIAELERHREAVARSFEIWSLGVQESLWARLREIRVPILWITGERDEKFTALGKRAVSTIPDASHEIMAQCGHRCPWENPIHFASLVLAFQNDLSVVS